MADQYDLIVLGSGATGSFDRRALDGADGARLMQVFKRLVEAPLGMLA